MGIFGKLFSRCKKEKLIIGDVYFHIGSRSRVQLLDFSNSVEGVCYIRSPEINGVGMCLKQQLKPIAR